MASLISQMLFKELPKVTTNGTLVSPKHNTQRAKLLYGTLTERIMMCLHVANNPLTTNEIGQLIGENSSQITHVIYKLCRDGLASSCKRGYINEYVISDFGRKAFV